MENQGSSQPMPNEVSVELLHEEVLLILDVLDVVAGMRLLQTWNAEEMEGLANAYRKLIEAAITEEPTDVEEGD